MCCDSWGRKESDTTERLNWTELKNSLMEICTNPPLASHPVQISSFACCVCVCVACGLSLVVASGGYSPVTVQGLLIVMASLVAEHVL